MKENQSCSKHGIRKTIIPLATLSYVIYRRYQRALDPSLPRTSNRGCGYPFAVRRSNIIRFRLAVDSDLKLSIVISPKLPLRSRIALLIKTLIMSTLFCTCALTIKLLKSLHNYLLSLVRSPASRQGNKKLVYRLIELFSSTEIFSKRRKIYAC